MFHSHISTQQHLPDPVGRAAESPRHGFSFSCATKQDQCPLQHWARAAGISGGVHNTSSPAPKRSQTEKFPSQYIQSLHHHTLLLQPCLFPVDGGALLRLFKPHLYFYSLSSASDPSRKPLHQLLSSELSLTTASGQHKLLKW